MRCFPASYAPLLALLRLGKAMSVFSFILLVVSGSLGIVSAYEILGIGRRALTGGTVLLLVLLLDLTFLAVLIGWRAEQGPRDVPPPDPGAPLPEYEETEVQDFH